MEAQTAIPQESESATTPATIKTVEERIQELELRSLQLEQALGQVDADFKYMFTVLQDVLGIRLIRDKETQRFGYMVQVPKKDQGAPGVLADLYVKMEKLWKRYGGEIILTR